MRIHCPLLPDKMQKQLFWVFISWNLYFCYKSWNSLDIARVHRKEYLCSVHLQIHASYVQDLQFEGLGECFPEKVSESDPMKCCEQNVNYSCEKYESISLEISVKTCILSSVPQIVSSVLCHNPLFQRRCWFDPSLIKSWNIFYEHFPPKIFVGCFWFLVVSWAMLCNNLFYTIKKWFYFRELGNLNFQHCARKGWSVTIRKL